MLVKIIPWNMSFLILSSKGWIERFFNSVDSETEIQQKSHSVWSITTPLSHAIIHERAIKKVELNGLGFFCLSVCLYYIHFHMSVVCPKRGSFSNVLFFHIVPFHYFALIFKNLNVKICSNKIPHTII